MRTNSVKRYAEVRDKVISGLAAIVDPVVSTITPKGSNVMFQNEYGEWIVSNDGFTIAKSIFLEDEIENGIVRMVRNAANKTNLVAGDGTSTSILFSGNLITHGERLVENGMNRMDLKRDLDVISRLLVEEVNAMKYDVSEDQQLEYVAKVSANNDIDIAKNVVRVVKNSGQDGLVFIENNSKAEVEIVEENGFQMDSGMFSPQLANQKGRFVATYEDVPVFITDKRLYYEQEVISILEAVSKMGYNRVVVIAADFIGTTPAMFIANHVNPDVNMSILLVKQPNPEILDDLAVYLKGKVISEKQGSFVDKLTNDDFAVASKILSESKKSIFLSKDGKHVSLDLRIEALRKKIEEVDEASEEGKEFKRRLACLTNGITTLKVGGRTMPEMLERMHRYEDSINATRNAMKEGFVVGGGITIYQAYKSLVTAGKLSQFSLGVQDLVKRFCEASLRQIAENCGIHAETLIEKVTDKIGYNAVTGEYENLLGAGIIEPVVVLRNTIENSISVSQMILSSNYLIVNNKEKEDE